jgi:hypothetical protein
LKRRALPSDREYLVEGHDRRSYAHERECNTTTVALS